jgi:ParB/RepB/Spo0J family partition protein
MAKRLKDLAVGTKDLFMLDPGIIREEPGWNVRIASPDLEVHIRQLADSIKEVGVLEPVTVYLRDGEAVLTNGHCRLMAVRLAIAEGAEIRAIPARAEERYAGDADRVLGMLTRNSGKPLSSLEQAEVIKRLLAFGWTEQEVAKKTGYSATHIANLVRLVSAPVQVREMVARGEVSARQAVETIRREGDGAVQALGEALATAREAGKSKATGKHLSRPRGTDWGTWGPRLKSALEGLLEALDRDDSWNGRRESEEAARFQLEEMDRG